MGHEIRTLDNMLKRNLTAKVKENGLDELTVMHGWVLGYLCMNQGRDIFQRDLEAEFAIRRSTVTNIVKLMEKKGYIRREEVESDARLKKIVLTDTGKEIHENIIRMFDETESELVEGISEEDVRVFFSVVSKIKENISNRIGEPIC